ncbi:MAG: hypothetical protein WCY88_09235 [Spongiibacteraceae bacterium]
MLSKNVLQRAAALLKATKALNYQGILKHDPKEVAKLSQALATLNGVMSGGKSVDGDADSFESQPINLNSLDDLSPASVGGEVEVDEKAIALARREQILFNLNEEGFGEREGKVYNSFASMRSISFKQVPHTRGLPPFDVVIAPDFAPVSGLHGVFISGDKIMSVILPSDNPGGNWEVLKTKTYKNEKELLEFVTLIAAGFDLP